MVPVSATRGRVSPLVNRWPVRRLSIGDTFTTPEQLEARTKEALAFSRACAALNATPALATLTHTQIALGLSCLMDEDAGTNTDPALAELATDIQQAVLMSSGPNAQAHARGHFDRMHAGKLPL